METGLNQSAALTDPQQIAAQLSLGKAYLQDGRFPAAAATFNQLIDTGQAPTETGFLLAQALAGAGDNEGAIAAYQAYLAANPEMAAYVQPQIAAAYLSLDDTAQAVAAYEAALAGPAHRLTIIDIHQKLADLYLAGEDYTAAVTHYNAIHDLAQTEFTYLGLIQLVDAGVPVDEFQRALVDYYADAYDPAIAAFQRYLADNPDDFRADAYLYLAWSYEALGDLETALAQLDAYATHDAARALIERARMMARAGDGETAIA
ncbi:MAG: tetratricopeptide repeat protein, partial [Anaerolineae bacterium]